MPVLSTPFSVMKESSKCNQSQGVLQIQSLSGDLLRYKEGTLQEEVCYYDILMVVSRRIVFLIHYHVIS